MTRRTVSAIGIIGAVYTLIGSIFAILGGCFLYFGDETELSVVGGVFVLLGAVFLLLGGMPLSGGMKSRVSCALVGSFTYALLSVGLPMLGVAANQVFVIKAILFLIVVVLTCRKKTGVLPR